MNITNKYKFLFDKRTALLNYSDEGSGVQILGGRDT